MRIHFEQTGGIMGRKVSLDLDTTELASDEVESIRQAIEDTDFFGLPENISTQPMPDEMQYFITVETATITHSVRVGDTSAPPAMSALIQTLSQLARTRRTKKE